MKNHLLIIASVLVFILAVSFVAASIALPPSNPPANSPGKELPRELQIAARETQRYFDEVFQPCLQRAETASEREEYFERWKEFSAGIRHFLQESGLMPGRLTKDMNLPNGNSPGQGN